MGFCDNDIKQTFMLYHLITYELQDLFWANFIFQAPEQISSQTTYNIQHFSFQLMHTTLKNVELLKHF